jgi:putative DNA methylase
MSRLIETDRFPFEFLSLLAKRESWRKEIHRPIYHVHKWWAKRLGSVFRGLALGSVVDEDVDLAAEFYKPQDFSNLVVFDPFLGSGTTLGEAHKLGFAALGRDINPVAAEAVRVALGRLQERPLEETFSELSRTVGERIRQLYRTQDSRGFPAEILYYFWVMQASCPACREMVDLFSSWVRARNAYPKRKPEVQVLCPSCGAWFQGSYYDKHATCPACELHFDPAQGPAQGAKATCRACEHTFSVREAAAPDGKRPRFRLYGKLVLTKDGGKEYLSATESDHQAYRSCVDNLYQELQRDSFKLPTLELEDGYNTRQAMAYGFREWRAFFNARQLLALGWLSEAIAALPDEVTRDAFLVLFSGALEFNNLFTSYKGEGTGAVRHMFAHHILKPERAPIEANLWGTTKSSGSFSGLFRSRLLRAIEYRQAPTELKSAGNGQGAVVCSPAFTGLLKDWRSDGKYQGRAVYISCGDSATTDLAAKSVDLVLTDPPFFDNVHYSELADFFYAWQQLTPRGFIKDVSSTRASSEVQDTDSERFADKLRGVFLECHRVLKDEGILVFTYHHSRDAGWTAVAEAILGAGFTVVNAHPLKAEMSVATPKAQAKEPIQLDIAIVCRKTLDAHWARPVRGAAIAAAKEKLVRLEGEGFKLSRNDEKVVLFGQLLTTLRSVEDLDYVAEAVEQAQDRRQRTAALASEARSAAQSTRTDSRRRGEAMQMSLFSPER